MEPRAHHILIGLFTLMAAAGALLFALWLGHSQTEREYDYYDVAFDRAVTGLAVGNSVLFRGIRVGDVLSLDFAEHDPRIVLARIRVMSDIPIKEDTRAALELANITGAMSIQLRGGSPESPELEGSPDRPPVIEADPSPVSALLSQGENILNNLDQFLENANRLVSDQNAENLTEIVANLRLATETLADQRGDLAEGLVQFNQLVSEISTLTNRLDGLVDQQGEAVLSGARGTLQAMEQLLTENQQALDQGLQSFNDLGPAIRELRTTLDAVQRLTRRVEDSPADALFGRDRIKEFNP